VLLVLDDLLRVLDLRRDHPLLGQRGAVLGRKDLVR
jgi:hypothetical protein